MQDNVRFWEKRRSAACSVWTCTPVSNASVVLFSCVSFVFGHEQNACLISSSFFFLACRASFLLFQKIAHTCKAEKGVALVGGTHLDALRLVLWKGADGACYHQIRLPCFQVLRTRNGCGLLLCRIDRSDQTAQLKFATCASRLASSYSWC